MHAVHHLLLGHGLATPADRGRPRRRRSIWPSPSTLGTCEPGDRLRRRTATRPVAPTASASGSTSTRCATAATRQDVVADLAPRGIELPVQDGDLEIISTPIDMLGVNYYFSMRSSPARDEDGSTRTPTACRSSAVLPLRAAADRDGLGDHAGRLHRAAGPARPRLPRPADRHHRERRGLRRRAGRRRLRGRRRPDRLPRRPHRGRRRGPRRREPTSAATSPGR